MNKSVKNNVKKPITSSRWERIYEENGNHFHVNGLTFVRNIDDDENEIEEENRMRCVSRRDKITEVFPQDPPRLILSNYNLYDRDSQGNYCIPHNRWISSNRKASSLNIYSDEVTNLCHQFEKVALISENCYEKSSVLAVSLTYFFQDIETIGIIFRYLYHNAKLRDDFFKSYKQTYNRMGCDDSSFTFSNLIRFDKLRKEWVSLLSLDTLSRIHDHERSYLQSLYNVSFECYNFFDKYAKLFFKQIENTMYRNYVNSLNCVIPIYNYTLLEYSRIAFLSLYEYARCIEVLREILRCAIRASNPPIDENQEKTMNEIDIDNNVDDHIRRMIELYLIVSRRKNNEAPFTLKELTEIVDLCKCFIYVTNSREMLGLEKTLGFNVKYLNNLVGLKVVKNNCWNLIMNPKNDLKEGQKLENFEYMQIYDQTNAFVKTDFFLSKFKPIREKILGILQELLNANNDNDEDIPMTVIRMRVRYFVNSINVSSRIPLEEKKKLQKFISERDARFDMKEVLRKSKEVYRGLHFVDPQDPANSATGLSTLLPKDVLARINSLT